MADRSLRASAEGIQIIRKAIKRDNWKQDELKDELGLKTRQPITRLLRGEAIERPTFEELCHLLGLKVSDVADETEQPEPPITIDINALVEEARSRIQPTIQTMYGKIRLLNGTWIEVKDLYVDVYLLDSKRLNLDEESLIAEHELKEDRLAIAKRGDRQPGMTVVEQLKRLVILGKPGMGKSTFLQYLAITCIQGDFQPQTVPVLLEFRDLDDSKLDLINWIATKLKLADLNQTKQLLDNARVLLLLDGLDEVPEQWQKTIQNQLRDFLYTYDSVQTIVTCRTQTTEFVPKGFECVEVAEFRPEQIEGFVRRWFVPLDQQGYGKADRFLDAIQESEPTAELMKTPLLLSLACWIFQDRDKLPSKRSELYEQGVDLLLRQWDEFREIEARRCNSEVYKALDIDQRKDLLSYLAHYKFTNPRLLSDGRENFILFQQPEIETLISEHLRVSRSESYKVLREIEFQHGLLVKRAERIYSFSHLSFQEYFAARRIVEARDPTALQAVATHVTDPRWREVFLQVTELLPNADGWLRMMKATIDGLLAKDEKFQELLRQICKKANLVDSIYKRAAARAVYLSLFLPFETEFQAEIKNRSWYIFDIAYSLYKSKEAYEFLSKDFYGIFRYRNEQALRSDLSQTFNIASSCISEVGGLYCLTKFIDFEISRKILVSIDSLKAQMPSRGKDIEEFEEWWQIKGEAWIAQVQVAMSEYRNIGHDWQFTDDQKHRLQQYYNANKLLIACLNTECYINRAVRQEIEDTLLLPISEIEKRRNP